MQRPADALLDRTRVACLDRAGAVQQALAAAAGGDDPQIGAALRELHAIKGEAAMGGLPEVGRLAHALEALVLQRRGEAPFYLGDAAEALRVLADVLATTAAEDLNSSPDLADLILEVEAAAGRPEDGEGAAAMEAPPRAPRAPPLDASGHAPARAAAPEGWLRVEARRIDDVSAQLAEITADLDASRALLAALSREDRGPTDRRAAKALAEQLDVARSRVAGLEANVWSLRLVPLSGPLQEFADHAEALARQLGKEVRAEADAGAVSLPRSMVEALREPLIHLVRNAVDHGIEPPSRRAPKPRVGRVRIGAESMGGEIVIAVEDDGAGISPDAVRRRAVDLGLVTADRARVLARDEALDLIFLDGFTERTEAGAISGRGVGLSAVRRSLEVLGGAVRVVAGAGTRFELVLPAAVARERALVITSGGLSFAIPARWVRLVVRDPEALAAARRTRSLRTHEGVVPARPLNAWLGAPREDDRAALVVEIAGRSAALLVGSVPHAEDLLRTPADPLLAASTRLAASAVLPDGRPAFFLRWAEVLREITQLTGEESTAGARPRPRAPRVLVVDDSAVIRDIVSEILTGAGVEAIAVEDGEAARDRIAREDLDLVISDVEMPRMDGFELLKAIRARSAVLPVIMLTTRSKPEHRREAALLGANAYIAKSEFRGDTLLDVVRRFVDLP